MIWFKPTISRLNLFNGWGCLSIKTLFLIPQKSQFTNTWCGSLDSLGSKRVDLWLMQLHRQQLSPKKRSDTESVTLTVFEI